jgi:hypothetical protein
VQIPRTALNVVFVMTLAVAFPFVCYALFYAFGFDVLSFQIRAFQKLGLTSSDTIKTFIHVTDSLIWAAILGLCFGAPLGIAVRLKIWRYWLLFLLTILVISIIGAKQNNSSIGSFADLFLSPFTIYVIAILVVWVSVAQLYSYYATTKP